MMKKYWGKKDWSDSLYLSFVYNSEEDDYDFTNGRLEFCYGMPFDWSVIMGFNDKNKFNDTNDFITYSESFNIFQYGKI